MAKHPVPKYKTPKSKTRARYASFARKKINKLLGMAKARNHTYKKAEEINKDDKKQKEVDKISKIKA